MSKNNLPNNALATGMNRWKGAGLLMLLGLGAFVLLLAQPSPKPGVEAAKSGSEVASTYQGLFEKPWSKKFAKLWNARGDSTRVLAGLGKVCFVRAGSQAVYLLVDFDSTGRVGGIEVLKKLPKDTLPLFEASFENWVDFMEGKFGAVAGVMTGKIKYTGTFGVALKYGQAFDRVAPVGRQASLALSKKGRN